MADAELHPESTPEPVWIEWSPNNVPHVVGRYTERVVDLETGLPDPQDFEVVCRTCVARWKGSCSSGSVRLHIQKFAARHQHRDPLAAPRIVQPGSLRSNGEDE